MVDPLFRSIYIGPLELPNRIFMPAMHLGMCRDFQISDRLIEFYRRRAQGGAALISVGYATVDEFSGGPTNIGAHDDTMLPGLTRLATAIHEGGARAAVQLNHAGRYNPSFFLGGRPPVAPSPIASRLTGDTPRELGEEEIQQIIKRFGQAALRVKRAGFDLVEILAGTGYLISEFLSPLTNQRTDGYGGELENRMRFGLEVIAEVKSCIGNDFPLMVRLNGNDFMEGGIGPDELLAFGQALERAGVHALCVNVGWHEAKMPQIVTKVPRGVFAYLARDMKKKVAIPVIASHRINDPQIARLLIKENFCDMVAIGRALIADPDLPSKARTGREEEIVHCVGCGQGCFDHIFKMKPVECLCNPKAGHEQKVRTKKAKRPRKVMVIGGGVAGMSAAISAAEQGHEVAIYEKTTRLGGQLYLAGAAPGRGEFLVFAEDLQRQLQEYPIEIHLNTAVDEKNLRSIRPDLLVLATGGCPVTPSIAGVDGEKVVQAWEVLAGRAEVGRRVVIIGGGAVGIECALLLAEEGTLSGEELKFLLIHGAVDRDKLYTLATSGSREIVVVEMTEELGANFGKSTRWGMLQDLGRYGVQTLAGSRVLAIENEGVRLAHGGEERLLAADTVVLAVGTRAENPLAPVAEELGIETRVVGDASRPATVFEANHGGYWAVQEWAEQVG